MTLETEILLQGLVFGEGPRWHDGKLWFSDVHAHHVMTVDMDGKSEVIVEVPGWPSGLGWLPDGRLLVVSVTDNRLLRLDPGGLTEVADLSKLGAFFCNDMVVDTHGRAYIGHIGYDLFAGQALKPATIFMVTPDGGTRVVADNMLVPNGMAMTPDGRMLIVAESMGARLTAFDVEADGSLTGQRIWAQLGEGLPTGIISLAELGTIGDGIVGPDGICLDAEGGVWVADSFGSEVLRVLEGGEVTDRIKISTGAVACMLGGPDRRTLFVMTSETGDPDEARAKQNGRVETVRVEVPGVGLP
jgi:sugar lactone lactonase YvrE